MINFNARLAIALITAVPLGAITALIQIINNVWITLAWGFFMGFLFSMSLLWIFLAEVEKEA